MLFLATFGVESDSSEGYFSTTYAYLIDALKVGDAQRKAESCIGRRLKEAIIVDVKTVAPVTKAGSKNYGYVLDNIGVKNDRIKWQFMPMQGGTYQLLQY